MDHKVLFCLIFLHFLIFLNNLDSLLHKLEALSCPKNEINVLLVKMKIFQLYKNNFGLVSIFDLTHTHQTSSTSKIINEVMVDD